jgi:hypothetical protein
VQLFKLTEKQTKLFKESVIKKPDKPFWADFKRFKKVAVGKQNGQEVYLSIFDGTVYEIGKPKIQKVQPHHLAGFYVYKTPKEAKAAKFPLESLHRDAEEFAILELAVGGRCHVYENGKIAYTGVKPLAEVTRC